jgi:hypothetical protein
MLRPRRFEDEYDPGPVQIQARKVHFDVSDVPLHWIPGHPVASNFASLLNIVLPPVERWFVAVFNEALPLVKDPKLAEDMRGFIGQEATHADVHQQVLHDLMVARGVDPKPLLDQVDFIFSRTLAPSTSPDPKRRLSHLCDRLWLIALQRADVWPPYSCRQGFCGTCRTRVLDGCVDHRDTLLTEPERADGMMLVCISRAAEGQQLTLDL